MARLWGAARRGVEGLRRKGSALKMVKSEKLRSKLL